MDGLVVDLVVGLMVKQGKPQVVTDVGVIQETAKVMDMVDVLGDLTKVLLVEDIIVMGMMEVVIAVNLMVVVIILTD
tara:strand:+ start:148 stop:378 length:231 start_codon:yes stop_codon:yes gene_type:complete